jgi:peroxiredoxin
MKKIKLICMIFMLTFVITGCDKKESEPEQQTDVKAETKPTKPAEDEASASPSYESAPSFTLQNVNGENVSLSNFKGKVVILDFWATWCPPCVMEIPHFIELYEQYKDRGFAMVGISLDREGVGVVKPFVRKYGVNYLILMSDGKVEKAYGGIVSIPTTFVIDPAGNIRRKYIGYRDKSVFEADIKELLPKPEVHN